MSSFLRIVSTDVECFTSRNDRSNNIGSTSIVQGAIELLNENAFDVKDDIIRAHVSELPR
jgi:hypothetical protein